MSSYAQSIFIYENTTETYKGKLNFDWFNVCDSAIGDESLLVWKRNKMLPQSQTF